MVAMERTIPSPLMRSPFRENTPEMAQPDGILIWPSLCISLPPLPALPARCLPPPRGLKERAFTQPGGMPRGPVNALVHAGQYTRFPRVRQQNEG